MSETLNISEISRRYTEALYSLAKDKSVEGEIGAELTIITKVMVKNKPLWLALGNPAVSSAQKVRICQKLRVKMHMSDIIGKFICLLAKKARLSLLSHIAGKYAEMLAFDRGETKAEAISAYPLDKDEMNDLKVQLEKLTKKSIFIDNKVDKNIIAGLIIKIGPQMIDFSVHTKLKHITHLMEGI